MDDFDRLKKIKDELVRRQCQSLSLILGMQAELNRKRNQYYFAHVSVATFLIIFQYFVLILGMIPILLSGVIIVAILANFWLWSLLWTRQVNKICSKYNKSECNI